MRLGSSKIVVILSLFALSTGATLFTLVRRLDVHCIELCSRESRLGYEAW